MSDDDQEMMDSSPADRIDPTPTLVDTTDEYVPRLPILGWLYR